MSTGGMPSDGGTRGVRQSAVRAWEERESRDAGPDLARERSRWPAAPGETRSDRGYTAEGSLLIHSTTRDPKFGAVWNTKG